MNSISTANWEEDSEINWSADKRTVKSDQFRSAAKYEDFILPKWKQEEVWNKAEDTDWTLTTEVPETSLQLSGENICTKQEM